MIGVKSLRTKTPKQISEDKGKQYELEKKIEKSFTHIDLKSQTALAKAQKLAIQFSNDHESTNIDFKAILKLYLLQNFSFESRYYSECNYCSNSLVNYLSVVRSVSSNNSSTASWVPPNVATNIIKFVTELKSVISPYPIFDELKDRRISTFLASKFRDSLMQDEIDYIQSPIGSGTKNMKGEEMLKSTKSTKSTKSRTRLVLREEDRIKLYESIATNWQQPIAVLVAMHPNLKKSTLQAYKSFLSSLERTGAASYTCPSLLIDVWKQKKQSYLSGPTKQTQIENPKVVKAPSIEFSSNQLYGAFDGTAVIKVSNSKDLLNGYIEAYNELADACLRLVKISLEELN